MKPAGNDSQGAALLVELSIAEQNAPGAAARIAGVEETIRAGVQDWLKRLAVDLGINDWKALGQLILKLRGWRNATDPYAWLIANMPAPQSPESGNRSPAIKEPVSDRLPRRWRHEPFKDVSAEIRAWYAARGEFPPAERVSGEDVTEIDEAKSALNARNPEPLRRLVAKCGMAHFCGPRDRISDYEGVIGQLIVEGHYLLHEDPIKFLRNAAVKDLGRQGGTGDKVSYEFRTNQRGREKGAPGDLSLEPRDEDYAGTCSALDDDLWAPSPDTLSLIDKVFPPELIDDRPGQPWFAPDGPWDDIADQGEAEGWLTPDQSMILPTLSYDLSRLPEQKIAEVFGWTVAKVRRIRKQLDGAKIQRHLKAILDPRGELSR